MIRRKFDRGTNQRKALFKSLANSLILHEKIETTEAKAKAVRPIIEKLITKAKKGDLFARRSVAASLGNPNATAKMFDLIGPRFKDRSGGYLRITKVGNRAGDAAKMANIEFVVEIIEKKAKVEKTKPVEVEIKEEKPKAAKTTKKVSKDGNKKETKSKK